MMGTAPRSPTQEINDFDRRLILRNVDHLVGIDEETEHEEDHNLGQPGHSVEEFGDAAVVGERGVSKNDAADVDSEIAVAGEGGGGGKGEKHGPDHEDGDHGGGLSGVLLGLRLGVDTAIGSDEPQSHFTHQKSAESTYAELKQEFKQYGAGGESASDGDGLNEDYGEHVGHRVIGTTLKFEHRPEVVAQANFLTAEDAEDRCGVGR